MQSLESKDSLTLKGIEVFHNHFRPHMGLDGMTPGEAAGIVIEGANKWITLIQNASKTE